MKKWVGWVLLALSLFITYQGWRNSQPGRDTQDMSRRTACEGQEKCTVEGKDPQSIRTNFFARDYEWRAKEETVAVRCQRAYVFAGVWSCQVMP